MRGYSEVKSISYRYTEPIRSPTISYDIRKGTHIHSAVAIMFVTEQFPLL